MRAEGKGRGKAGEGETQWVFGRRWAEQQLRAALLLLVSRAAQPQRIRLGQLANGLARTSPVGHARSNAATNRSIHAVGGSSRENWRPGCAALEMRQSREGSSHRYMESIGHWARRTDH
uniref:Uncharacterized protein n=1 Tax=Bionectria ochroleuca TaxID=29856 RepID=A0A8H7NL16_BIOOC